MLKRAPVVLAFLLAATVVAPRVATGASEPAPVTVRGAEVVGSPVVPRLFEGDLRDLPLAVEWRPGDPIKEIPRRHLPRPGVEGRDLPEDALGDPLLERQADAPAPILGANEEFFTPILNFNGQGFTGVNPPDTVGDVGPGHYIQMINGSSGARFTVHDKETGVILAGPTNLESLGTSNCASGLGDPVVLYDRLADRWMLSEFSASGNRLCVYVSLTPDPIAGGWCAYNFQATNFPDYPKYGVWPDAYYVSTNENNPAAYALDRTNMLACATARPLQRFTAPDLSGFPFQALIPSDLDGPTAPPAGSPNYFMRHNDDEVHGPPTDPSQDFLEIFEFHVDFDNPGNSTFTGPIRVGIANIDSTLCGLVTFSCFDQPGGGSDLDPLREVVMWRLQYLNFGTHEALVGNLVTDVGADQGGKRWFELRKSGAGPWALFQEGTYAIDSADRWMGSISMDRDGNMALGYNVVDDTANVFPGLRYVGRLAGDPLGTLPQGEVSLVEGVARNSSNRYGDYSSLNVDPADDCTFWFTGEWNPTGSWSTRIGAFRFDTCTGGGGGIPCADVQSFLGRCRLVGGDPTIQARVTLTDTSHNGETVEVSVDGVPHVVSIVNRRANLVLGGVKDGLHDVELTDPAGCFAAVTVNCPAP